MTALERQQWFWANRLVDKYLAYVEHDLVVPLPPPLDVGLIQHIEDEARCVMRDRRDRQALTMHAVPYVQWALEKEQERNPIVLARFGVEMAFTDLLRMKIQSTLGDNWVRRWRWESHEGRPRLAWSPTLTTAERLPLSFNKLQDLRCATDVYGGDVLNADNVVTPFAGLKPSYPWVMDPMRLPVAAVRAAAALIERHLGDGPLDVLALETGHNVAAQALAVFMDRATIYTESSVFHHDAPISMPDQYDAVVANLPGAAAVAFVRRALVPKPMTRKEIDRYWTWKPSARCSLTGPTVKMAMEKVRPGGVLVLLGDVESGAVHHGAAIVRKNPNYRRVRVGGHWKPVMFRYDRKVWGVYGTIRPTARLVSAWRRMV